MELVPVSLTASDSWLGFQDRSDKSLSQWYLLRYFSRIGQGKKYNGEIIRETSFRSYDGSNKRFFEKKFLLFFNNDRRLFSFRKRC